MSKFNLVITGHGHFATGLKSAVTLLAGEQDNISYVDFSEEMDDKELHNQLLGTIKKDSPTVIFTDLIGGSPYKEAAKIAYENNQICVVAGCNLASILETIYKDYNSVNEFANDLVKTSKLGTQVLNLSDLTAPQPTPSNFDDGI